MSEIPEKKNYKTTLNLPQTDFPMEAKLVANEPARLKKWQGMHLYKRILVTRSHGKKWILHDGPPFANGDIHMGHVINKTLKDVILRFRTMEGRLTPYVPGWDCHGLPIEHKIQQDLGPKLRQMNTLEVRKLCCAYAEKYVKTQSEQFQRLGILGDWDNPYLTLKPQYEADTLEVFARFVEAGLVYKQLKPVHWSIENQTVLADAELEYQDRKDTSVFVLFEVSDLGKLPPSLHAPKGETTYLMVWTTTPWTLPANMAIAVNPDEEYGLYELSVKGKTVRAIIAQKRSSDVLAKSEGANPKTKPAGNCAGKDLIGLEYKHPFMDRQSKVVGAGYVTMEDGTGLVHTAPGHGEEDYETGRENGLEIYCPVLANGRFDDTVPEWIRGKSVWEANGEIKNKLDELGVLYHSEEITHSYPHDWRSKKPTIFRATEQWFVKIDQPFNVKNETAAPRTLRDRAKQACRTAIEFIPAWGQARMLGMLQSRPDWCVSRQRAWGLPIPVFYNEKGEALLSAASVRAVSKSFREKGSDAWFTDSPEQLLGGDFTYPPGFEPSTLRKEKDIFDVWFESGSSWHAVLQERSYLGFPADMYLEGSDQHRGWFQLSLLPSLGATGMPPFRQVLTHGFIVKPDGTKVSKSDKEYVTATQEIERHGADLLRLWCCSVDYQGDIPTSPKVIQEFGDKYRKIRNTLRYLLANLYDFNPNTDAVPIQANSLDGWAASELDQLITEVTAAYDVYQLHRAFRLLHDFCAVQISAVYGNAMKDRMYCETPDSPLRRRTQTVMYRMATALAKLLAPMLVFTADEVWEYVNHKPAEESDLPSVHLTLLPKPSGEVFSDEQREDWKILLSLRDQALTQLDKLKRETGLNKAMDAEIVYQIDDDQLRRRLQAYGADLEDLVGVGHHTFAEKAAGHPSVTVKVLDRRNDYQACARSWKRRPDVGGDSEFPDLSLRDAAAVRRMGK